MEAAEIIPYVAAVAKVVFALAFVMQIVPVLIWGERKFSAYIQDRPGPNRAHIMGIRAIGLVHVLVDVVKLITKEDIQPDHVEKRFWFTAPIIAMSVALSTFVVIPWGDQITLPAGHLGLTADLPIKLQVADINGGLLYILAIGSLGVYGIMLAGWASNNKFSLLGGLRSSAQMVSYELAMGLSVVAMFMVYGTARLDEIVAAQSGPIWNWGVFAPSGVVVGTIAFLLFWTSVFAETNRLPFDMPEGESELVAGYHIEYSSLRFALFFMAEYAHMIVGSAVTATLFFGGYSIPFLTGETIRAHSDLVLIVAGFGGAPAMLVAAVMAWRRRGSTFYNALPANDIRHREPKFWVAVFVLAAFAHLGLGGLGLSGMVGATSMGPDFVAFALHTSMLGIKVLIGTYMMIWVRWTLPRFRYDQVMRLGWKTMLPIAIANVMLAGVWLIVRDAITA